ncbi:hypothetical protein Hanom_Chr14g01290391 [Helianthus anomalus]
MFKKSAQNRINKNMCIFANHKLYPPPFAPHYTVAPKLEGATRTTKGVVTREFLCFHCK